MATAKNKRRVSPLAAVPLWQVHHTNIVQKGPSSEQLSKSEDWIFRIKVISSAINLHNELFKDAVRGLVRICFPDGILEQLGEEVVKKHMHEQHANTANIQRMSEIFKSEMV